MEPNEKGPVADGRETTRLPDLATLRELASGFQTAIERSDREELRITFENFPRGSCGDTTDLWAEFLKDPGCGTFRRITGQRGDHSHAWLMNDGVIVDITADQFGEMPETVIVAPRSPWHESFEQEDVGEAGFRKWQSRSVQFERAYALILKNL